MLAAQTSVEVRTDAFFHSSELFRKIYGNVGVSYGVEASTELMNCWCLDGWANFDWFSKKGESTGCEGDSTRVHIGNISFGVKYPFQIYNCLTAYAGLGPSFSRIWLKNHSNCTKEKQSRFVCGGILKTGVCYYFYECMFLDVFVDYLYQPVRFHRYVDIGGFKTGAGIGIVF